MSDTVTTAATGTDEFAALEAQAADLQQAATPPDPDAPQPGQVAAEAAETVELVASIVVPLLPDRYAVRYGAKEVGRIADAFGALCEARGWSMGALIGKWGPELALLTAVVGPALPVLMADVKARGRAQPLRPVASDEAEGVRP